jgi:hypothetical protein
MCCVTGNTHLSTWIAAEAKQRFTAAAVGQGLSESALLKRLVERMLASGAQDAPVPAPTDARTTRLTVRLVAEDRALLRERAAARNIRAATYVSLLIRSHLRQLAPLPDRELSALRGAVSELSALGRNLNMIARMLNQGALQSRPGDRELHAMIQVCGALRDHFRALIKANLVSWEVGHAEQG